MARTGEKHLFKSVDLDRILDDLAGTRYTDIQILALAVRATHLEADVIGLQTQLLAVKNAVIVVAGLLLFGRFRAALSQFMVLFNTARQAIEDLSREFPMLEREAKDFLNVVEEAGGLVKEIFGAVGAVITLIKLVYNLNSAFIDALVEEIEHPTIQDE